MAEAKLRPIQEMTPAEAREQIEVTARARKAEPLPVGRVEEQVAPAPPARSGCDSTGRQRRRQFQRLSIITAAGT